MKKIFVLLCILFTNTAIPDTISLNWMDGNTMHAQTTCTVGGDLILPSAPTPAYGYHFTGWASEYIFLEYIESTGTQYIDTGVVLSTAKSEIYLDAQKTNATGRQAFMGAQVTDDNTSNTIRQILYYPSDFAGFLRWYNDSGTFTDIQNVDATTRHSYHITCDASNAYSIEIDNVVRSSGSQPEPSILNISLYLFAKNKNGNADQLIHAKIYSFWVKDANDTLVRNFIPAKRMSDNAVGMLDMITNTFFENAGTGEFIGGPVVQ